MNEISHKLKKIEDKTGHLSAIQKILLGTDGSVTNLLEVITGKPVEITTNIQKVIDADEKTAQVLDINTGDPVNYRVVEIKNLDSSEVLIYAVSHTPINRLSPEIKSDMMRADIPIGKILKNHHVETRREITDAKVLSADGNLCRTFKIFSQESLLSRQYKVIHCGKPLIAINEIFPCNKFLNERSVLIEAPSRLHLGLIDMNANLGRVDGGIGITLKDPSILLEARMHKNLEVRGENPETVSIIKDVAKNVIKKLKIPGGASITVHSSYPRHTGLGSGTSLSLTTARAICELYGKVLSTGDLSRLTGRGGTSGIGTAAFESGGFIMDGGHSFGSNAEKYDFSPSSASEGVNPAPVTVNYPFPNDWKILLATPDISHGANGSEEQDIFKKYCPVPLNEVRQMCHELLMRTLPGIVEHDLELFGKSVNNFQKLGFKKVELALSPDYFPVLLEGMREAGAACSGMSSFGPTLYAIGNRNMEDVEQAAIKFMNKHDGGETCLTSARNTGAKVRIS